MNCYDIAPHGMHNVPLNRLDVHLFTPNDDYFASTSLNPVVYEHG